MEMYGQMAHVTIPTERAVQGVGVGGVLWGAVDLVPMGGTVWLAAACLRRERGMAQAMRKR